MDQFIHVWWPVLLPIIVVVVGGVVAGVFTIINRRGDNESKGRIPLPPTWPEMWARIDALEKRVETLEDEKDKLQRTSGAMLTHIRFLEGQIPTPPGAPERPAWTQELSIQKVAHA